MVGFVSGVGAGLESWRREESRVECMSGESWIFAAKASYWPQPAGRAWDLA